MQALYGYDVVCDLAPGHPLRPRRRRPRVSRRARRRARASSGPRSTGRSRTTAPPSSTCSPTPADTYPRSEQPGLTPRARASVPVGSVGRSRCSRKRSRSTTTRVIRPAPTRPPVVGHRDPEGEAATLDRLEHRLGLDAVTDRHRRQVVELDPVADGGRALGELALDRHSGSPPRRGGRAGAWRARGRRRCASAIAVSVVSTTSDTTAHESGLQRHGERAYSACREYRRRIRW